MSFVVSLVARGRWAKGGRCSWDPLTTLLAVRGVSVHGMGMRECTDCDGVNTIDPRSGNNL